MLNRPTDPATDLDADPATGTSKYRWLLPIIGPSALGFFGLLWVSRSAAGSLSFYIATFVTAALWLFSWYILGPRDFYAKPTFKQLGRGILIGLVAAAVFILGALVVRGIPVLAAPVTELLQNMRVDSVPLTVVTLVLNGIAEELFFRGAAHQRLRQHLNQRTAFIAQVLLYTAVTTAMGVPLLLVGSVAVSALATFEVDRNPNGLSATAVHLTWSLSMAFLLTPLFS